MAGTTLCSSEWKANKEEGTAYLGPLRLPFPAYQLDLRRLVNVWCGDSTSLYLPPKLLPWPAPQRSGRSKCWLNRTSEPGEDSAGWSADGRRIHTTSWHCAMLWLPGLSSELLVEELLNQSGTRPPTSWSFSSDDWIPLPSASPSLLLGGGRDVFLGSRVLVSIRQLKLLHRLPHRGE